MPRHARGFNEPDESAQQKVLMVQATMSIAFQRLCKPMAGRQGLFGFGVVSKPSAMSSSGESSISTTSGCRGSMVLRRS